MFKITEKREITLHARSMCFLGTKLIKFPWAGPICARTSMLTPRPYLRGRRVSIELDPRVDRLLTLGVDRHGTDDDRRVSGRLRERFLPDARVIVEPELGSVRP